MTDRTPLDSAPLPKEKRQQQQQQQAQQEQQKQQKQATAPLIAGLSGGTVSTMLLLPLDNVKVRLQVHEGESRSVPASNKTTNNSRKKSTRMGFVRVFRGLVRHEGVAGLYQGLIPAVVGSSVSWGGFFFFYEGLKRKWREQKFRIQQQPHEKNAQAPSIPNIGDSRALPELTAIDNFLLACTSGAVMVGITNPVWLIKLRIQLQMRKASEQLLLRNKHTEGASTVKVKQPYTGMIDAARTIVRDEGFFALYKGSGPALLLTSHGGVQFVVYEFLRKHFHYARAKRKDDEDNNFTAGNKGGLAASKELASLVDRLEKSAGYLTMGAVAKMIASTVTYPLQVVKARLQQRSEVVELTADGEIRVVQREYSGISAAMRRILEKEGPTGFFKGCIPNAMRVAPSAAVTFVVYEAVMDFFGTHK